MKSMLIVLALLIPLQGFAEIYKCTDGRQQVVYQDTPCAGRTIGRIRPAPAPPDSAVLEARRELERMARDSRYFDQKRREEWAKQQEALRYLAAEEMREQERLAADAYRGESWLYIPAYGPGYGHRPFAHHRHHPRHPGPAMPAPKRDRPCVIGYIGDRSCR